MEKISDNITFSEATKSQEAIRLGINNSPNDVQLSWMRQVATKIFEPLRKHFGKPIGISSFFRSGALNKKIGGSKNSQHTEGKAVDIDADIFGGLTNKQIFDYLRKYADFDQLIWEFGDYNNPAWVHVSYNGTKNRNQVLMARKVEVSKGKFKTVYEVM